MFTVSVSHGALKALCLIAPDNDARTALNSVCVDTTTPGRVHLIATDGHRMIVVGNATAEGDISAGEFVIPVELIRGIKQRGTERYPQPITIEITPTCVGRGEVSVCGKESRTGQLLDARFAQWQRVIPRKTSGKLAHFNLGYLGDFQRAAEYLGHEYPVIQHNGDDAALIDLGPDAFGVLMPIRKPKEGAGIPEWLDPVKAESKAA